MLSERMFSRPWFGAVNKLTDGQIAHISTWAVVPDQEVHLAALRNVRIVPNNYSTVTEVNPLDPGDGWRERPSRIGVTVHHHPMRY